ncbi:MULTISPECIES: hypothetical protein [Nocardiaceae]|uniref:Uncharacterized protein n=1 Tax=Rhodococcoides corynebacterioides TaxID=53972 RepID=A0ABS2KTJ0_9NOCA|nr:MULTISPECIES: hypothetical protein [Rhodococcus]MBM7415254.1 hypothetical protein [Rhodococcus corynebacterioides]MBP1117716.1 hypothetical protein [Rhodococcus sp. PvP016]
MANPAALLHGLLTSWCVNGSASDIRGIDSTASPAWSDVRRAMGYVDAISEALAGQQAQQARVTPYVEAVPRWTAAIVGYPHGWNQDSASGIPTQDLALLDTLAGIMDTWIARTTDEQRDDIRQFSDRIAELVKADDSLSEEIRLYLANLVLHLRDCLDRFDIVGDFDLRIAVDRLMMAVGVASVHSTSEKSRWKDVAEQFVYPFTVSVASSPLVAVLGQLAIGS